MKAETQPITLRFRQSMINAMDTTIEKRKQYSNKPDFIVWAMRESYNHTLYVISNVYKVLEKVDLNAPEFKGIDDKKILQFMIMDSVSGPELYDGEIGKPILIRVPVGLVNDILRLNKAMGSPFKSIQDYCKYAVASSLENESDRDEIFEEFVKLSENPNDREIIRKLLESQMPMSGRTDWEFNLG